MNLYDELRSLVDALSSAQVEYAICGGLALAIHGHPRMTTGIDLLVREEDLLRITEIVKACGFTLPSGRIPFHLAQGRTVRIVSREGLATMKRRAGRPQDLADIDALGAPTDDTEPSA